MKQIGPPITVEGWLCRAVHDPAQPHVFAEAVRLRGQGHAIVTSDGLSISRALSVPNAVLRAALKIAGWKLP